MDRVTLSNSASLDYFGELIRNYSEIIDKIDDLTVVLNKIKDHEDMKGGIVSFINSTLEHTYEMSNYQISALSNLYLFMSKYYTRIGEDLYSSWQAAENDVKYTNAMKEYFYNQAASSIPIANALSDPYKLPSDEYSLVNVNVGEDGSIQQAYKGYYGNDRTARTDYAQLALDEYGEREKTVPGYGLMETSKHDFDVISKETGVAVDDIISFNIENNRIEMMKDGNVGFKSNTILIPAYKSSLESIRVATHANGSSYDVPTFENSIGGN